MTDFQWWCASQPGVQWTTEWRAYPGVWVFVLVVGAAYWRIARDASSARRALGLGGLAAVWLALDWPVGTLGSGYLASVHMGQYILLSLVAPPLLVTGISRSASDRLGTGPVGGLLRRATNPVVAVPLFIGVFLASHAPPIADRLMATQLGSFTLDVAWLLSGILFWWPIVGEPPGRAALPPPLAALALFATTLAHTPISMWLVLTSYPVYATYELAPPIPGWLTALEDQQVAGGIMLTIGAILVLGAVTTVLLRWMGTGAEPNEPQLAIPDDGASS